MHSMGTSFINIYVRGTLYPANHETLAQLVIALVVLASWIGFVRMRPTSDTPEPTPALHRHARS
jgi:hypothetical protein